MKKKLLVILSICLFSISYYLIAGESFVDKVTQEKKIAELIEKHGESNKFRIERGVEQVAQFWHAEDGSKEDFETFCEENFIGDSEELDATFQRIGMFDESINGYFTEMIRDLRQPLQLDWGAILPIDMLMGQFNPAAHLNEDFYENKIAFIILLNFPHYSLKEKKDLGPAWSSKEWALARIGDTFTSRVPARVFQNISKVMTEADIYISEYNIFMGKIVGEKQKAYFPEEMKLISHWGLRDELKARYSTPEGLKKQEIIYQIMKRIIFQEIPEGVVNEKTFTWNPMDNKLFKDGREVSFEREPNTRYHHFLEVYKAMNLLDPYYPTFPTHVKRMFEMNREIPYEEVEAMFTELLSSKQLRETGKLIGERLGRSLRPFDIWYTGFTSKQSISEEELDRLVSEKYPNLKSFEKDLPNILIGLGFSKEQAQFISPKIQVDPARGAGHCGGADIKTAKARLRTRVPEEGMNYKGFNIAMHELGHAVEQTLTLHKVDYYSLHGVPNVAFTEAFAFVFQGRDLEVLGIKSENREAAYFRVLDHLWSTYEIMGVALVDMRAWNWLYQNPDATPAQLKEAVISIAKDVWNKYYADIFGLKDEPILCIYSHMIDGALYLPDYPLGHIIQFQIEKYMEGKNLGKEMERMCKVGIIIPQEWMKNAVGSKISTRPLMDAADEALAYLQK